MNLDSRVPLKVCDEEKNTMLEIIHVEKHLWSLIYSKGLLHKEAQDSYVEVCSKYETMILSDHEEVEFQEIEYSLWKLHYKHIHEFRRRISQSSKKSEIECYAGKYKLFLNEATKFYQNLISKIRKFYGLGKDNSTGEKGQYSCHRFLVCLGDLARYRELCENMDVQKHNWSVAASYYFKAASTWPDSGNPQNQLAVLAKYIGDDFLALYHCVRSLAVKEPFPDAWNNLILLLEENRSSQLETLSVEAHFDFLNPSERSSKPMKSSRSEYNMDNNDMQGTDHTSSSKSAFWSLFVRMISLFFLQSSSEEFSHTFACTMRDLESVLDLNDIQLSAFLESYQYMDSNRKGPYRAIQLVSILVFLIDNVTTRFEHKDSEKKTNLKQQNLIKSALTATFNILGRLMERSLKANSVKSNPLLPAVLVFVEWFAFLDLGIVQKYISQDEVASAVSYFLDTFVELLNKLEAGDKLKTKKDIALWEDYELRGFAPVSSLHKILTFKVLQESVGEFVDGDMRIRRFFDAAMRIIEKSCNFLRNWIFYDTEIEKFFRVDTDLKESQKTKKKAISEKEKVTQIIAPEDEEEIIFKPLSRHNSAPIYSQDQETTTENTKDEAIPPDDSLKRATSLLSGRIQSSGKPETLLKASATSYPASPPSLNAWVLDKENAKAEKEKAAIDFFKPRLTPIEEMGSLSLIDSPPYSAPIPSAPLLPENALLFCEKSRIYGESAITSSNSIYTERPFLDGPSGFTPMSSSEWLHQFRNQNPNINRTNYLVQPAHFYTPGNMLSPIDRWGYNASDPNQIVYPEIQPIYADGLRRDNLFHNYQRLSPYGCGGDVAELRAGQPQLLQYLKEKERQLQNQAQVRGPAYMGNQC